MGPSGMTASWMAGPKAAMRRWRWVSRAGEWWRDWVVWGCVQVASLSGGGWRLRLVRSGSARGLSGFDVCGVLHGMPFRSGRLGWLDWPRSSRTAAWSSSDCSRPTGVGRPFKQFSPKADSSCWWDAASPLAVGAVFVPTCPVGLVDNRQGIFPHSLNISRLPGDGKTRGAVATHLADAGESQVHTCHGGR